LRRLRPDWTPIIIDVGVTPDVEAIDAFDIIEAEHGAAALEQIAMMGLST